MKLDAHMEAQKRAEIEEFKRMQEELLVAEEKKLDEEKKTEDQGKEKSHEEEEDTKEGIRIASKIGTEEIKPAGKKAVTFDT